ncbi:MAG: hypothetical protein Q9165_007691 [Trypethelium subeluteriae]
MDFQAGSNQPATFTVEQAANLFGSLGKRYENAYKDIPEQNASLDWLLTQLKPRSRILDIGCGTGKPVVATLSDAGHDTKGVDFSPGMIEVAKSQVPGASFEVLDARKLPDEPNSYDAITSYFALLAAISRDDIRQVFHKVHQNLKPGGFFVFATVPVDMDDQACKFVGYDVRITSMTPDQYNEALSASGFEILKSDLSQFRPDAVGAGICGPEDENPEPQLFVYARKPNGHG